MRRLIIHPVAQAEIRRTISDVAISTKLNKYIA